MARKHARKMTLAVALILGSGLALGQGAPGTDSAAASGQQTEDPRIAEIRALQWVKGPTNADISGNSTLSVPQNYLFLNAADTKKFLEINKNLGDGKEEMVMPRSEEWAAYLEFEAEGYVKDDEKIDAPALLKTLKENSENANEERRRRGYPELHVIDWAVPPTYNSTTKRLEWATTIQSNGSTVVNFYTKVLGRRGFTTIDLVTDPDKLTEATAQLDTLLDGYKFNSGESYTEYKPGDKVAAYGLGALILGGAAAVAAKKGLFGVLAGFFAAAWKFIVAGVVAATAWLRRMFGKKTQ